MFTVNIDENGAKQVLYSAPPVVDEVMENKLAELIGQYGTDRVSGAVDTRIELGEDDGIEIDFSTDCFRTLMYFGYGQLFEYYKKADIDEDYQIDFIEEQLDQNFIATFEQYYFEKVA